MSDRLKTAGIDMERATALHRQALKMNEKLGVSFDDIAEIIIKDARNQRQLYKRAARAFEGAVKILAHGKMTTQEMLDKVLSE